MTHVRTLIRLAHAQRGTQQVDAAAASLDEAERLLDAFAGQRRLEMADLHNARTMVAYSRLDREAVVRHARAEYELLRDLGRGDSPSADVYKRQVHTSTHGRGVAAAARKP